MRFVLVPEFGSDHPPCAYASPYYHEEPDRLTIKWMAELAILTDPSQTAQWADEVAKAADSDRRALGFIPKPKYTAVCEAGRIFVATVADTAGRRQYVGHIMFGGAGSELHIQQLFVATKYRKRGVGKSLLDGLISWAESRNCNDDRLTRHLWIL